MASCSCSAYAHKHRLLSGKCDGRAWVSNYWDSDGSVCPNCIHYDRIHSVRGRYTCGVLHGVAPPRECLGIIEEELKR